MQKVIPIYAYTNIGYQEINLVFGIFLIRDKKNLVYAGTSIRYSKHSVVNLSRNGELGVLVEPEWGIDYEALDRYF